MRTGLHTREDHFPREWRPADNKLLAKYKYGGKPNVQTVPNVLSQEELSANDMKVDKHEYEKEPGVQYSTTTPDDQEEPPADNEQLNKYEYSNNKIVMTSLTGTLNAERMLAYMNKNYKNTSPLMTWRTRTASTRPTERWTSPTMKKLTACHDRRQRLGGPVGA
jgi:hypothetical protein